MKRLMLSSDQIVQIYDLRNLGADWKEIGEKINPPIKAGVAYQSYRKVMKYVHNEVKGKKFQTYMDAATKIWVTQKTIEPSKEETEIKQEIPHIALPITPTAPRSVYEVLENASLNLQKAIEDVIEFEVHRRTETIKKEYEDLRDKAKNANWVKNLQDKFQGGEKKSAEDNSLRPM